MVVRDRRAEPRRTSARAHLQRWVETAGAQLLVVDPRGDVAGLGEAMAARGVHVTWARTMLEGLVAFGRTRPHAVLVAPSALGASVADFVETVRRMGGPGPVAVVDDGTDAERLGAALLAGASVVPGSPYDPDRVLELVDSGPRPVDDHARVAVGPIVLDSAAFTVRVDGERIADLPLKEFELLRALMVHAPDVVTDEQLREALWGGTGRRPGGNTISMHVTRLRARLDGVADIRRVRGRGYSLTL